MRALAGIVTLFKLGSNESAFAISGGRSGYSPLTERIASKRLHGTTRDEVAINVEVVVHGGMNV
jgi:hypothetical protein